MLAGLNHYYRKSLRWAFENRTFWLVLSGVQNLDIKFKSLSRSEYKKWQKDSGATDFLMKNRMVVKDEITSSSYCNLRKAMSMIFWEFEIWV